MHQAIQYIGVTILDMAPQVRKRVSQDAVRRLAQTVQRIGIRLPLRVRRVGKKFLVVDGHLRLLAAKAAGLPAVPCIIEEKELTDGEICEQQLILNRRREELRPIEFAEAIQRFMQETQCTASETAERLGESPPTISRHLALLKLPAAIRNRVDSGAIPASAAYKLTQVGDARRREELAAELSAGRLTRDDLNVQVNDKEPRGARGKHAPKPPQLRAVLSGGRTVTFAGLRLERVGELVAWLEELLALAKSQPADADVATFVTTLQQAAKARPAIEQASSGHSNGPTPSRAAAAT